MRFLTIGSVLVAAIGIATPAMAQDSTPDMSDSRATFTGARVEFLGGYNRTLPNRSTSGPSRTTSQTPKHDGGIAGVQAGYDVQAGPVVVGIFGGYSLATDNGCGSLGGLNTGCLRPERQIEGGGRIGYQYGNRVLLYAKGSYVNTSVKTTVLSGTQYQNSHINLDGWRVGGGAEFAVTRHAYIKAEYDYGRTEHFDASPYGFPNTRIDYHTHAVLGGVGIRF